MALKLNVSEGKTINNNFCKKQLLPSTLETQPVHSSAHPINVQNVIAIHKAGIFNTPIP